MTQQSGDGSTDGEAADLLAEVRARAILDQHPDWDAREALAQLRKVEALVAERGIEPPKWAQEWLSLIPQLEAVVVLARQNDDAEARIEMTKLTGVLSTKSREPC